MLAEERSIEIPPLYQEQLPVREGGGTLELDGIAPPLNETQVDHKIPKVKGGPGEVDNAQVLCRDCNLKKGSEEPMQGKAEKAP